MKPFFNKSIINKYILCEILFLSMGDLDLEIRGENKTMISF